MSRSIEFQDVRRRILEYGGRTSVISVTPEMRPHVVTAMVEIGDERLLIHVGQRTHANLELHPHLTLTWPPVPGGEYHLIVDGFADHIGEPDERGVCMVTVAAERGILHRLSDLATPGPSCVSL